MRRAGIAALALAAAVVAAPSSADHPSPEGAPFDHAVERTLHAPLPCAVACPYWIGDLDAACSPDPAAAPGQYDDWDFVLEPPPDSPEDGFVFFVYGIDPVVDHDLLLCGQEPLGGSWFIGPQYGLCGGPCYPCTLEYLVGCRERGEENICVDVTYPPPDGFHWYCLPRGSPVRIRVYNWADPFGDIAAWTCWSPSGITPTSNPCGRV